MYIFITSHHALRQGKLSFYHVMEIYELPLHHFECEIFQKTSYSKTMEYKTSFSLVMVLYYFHYRRVEYLYPVF